MANAHQALAMALEALEMYEAAEREFAEALASCRKLAADDPAAHLSDLTRILTRFSLFYDLIQRSEDANRLRDEAAAIRREFGSMR